VNGHAMSSAERVKLHRQRRAGEQRHLPDM
jgi:hypothetical protein